MRNRFTAFLFCCLVTQAAVAQDAVKAANTFIQTLSPAQKQVTLFSFDEEERYNFHFVPKERKGITFNEMTAEQKAAAHILIRTCLSEKASRHTEEIMQLDQVLKILENRKEEDHYRDTGNYHLSFFGIPSGETIWGWRLEGHHISFTFCFDKQKMVSGTPGFLGANPGIVREGPQEGKQVLKAETDLGYALVQSLNSQQRNKALLSDTAPADILSSNKRSLPATDTSGIAYSLLNPAQQQQLLHLIKEYVNRYTRLFAADMLKEIESAGLAQLHFAWAGSTEKGAGQKHYYKITGPTLLIEYDNTQNNGNHVHSVIRDLQHDFGGDLLLEHYRKAHKPG